MQERRALFPYDRWSRDGRRVAGRANPVTHPIPEVTANDLARVLHRDFDDHAAARALLDDVSQELSLRAQIAAVKCSSGSLPLLLGNLEQAQRDERDVISNAEYPRFTALPTGADEPTRNDAIVADWGEYSDWLGRDV